MSEYHPDMWAILHVISQEHPPIDKVVGSWFGGHGSSDSWRMNSGIEKVVDSGDCYDIHGFSGSIYHCHKGAQGMSRYTEMIMNQMATQLEEGGLGMMRVIDIKELL